MTLLVEQLTEEHFDSNGLSVCGGSGLFSADPEQPLPPSTLSLARATQLECAFFFWAVVLFHIF